MESAAPMATGSFLSAPGTDADPAARLDRLPVSGWHRRVVGLLGAVALCGLYQVLVGPVIAAAAAARWRLDGAEGALLTSSTFIGMAIGAFVLGPVMDRWGRQRTLAISLVLSSLASAASAFGVNLGSLSVLRALTGLGLAAGLIAIDSYLAETAPPAVRGRLTAWVYAIGFLAVPVVSLIANRAVAGHPLLIDGWRWLALAGLGGMAAAHYVWHELPESPRWLAARGRREQADAIVAAIETAVEAETGRRLSRPRLDLDRSGRRWWEMFRAGYRRRTLLLWTIASLRAAGFYGFAVLAPAELMSKGYSVVESLAFATVSCLAYPIGASLSAGVLDRFDRKNVLPLAAIATAVLGLIFGSAADSALIVVSGVLLSLCLALLITGCHAYQAEIVPTPARGASLGLAYAIGCLVAAGLTFPTDWLVANAGPSSMFTVTAIAVLALGGAVWNLGPSTSRRPLERASRPARG